MGSNTKMFGLSSRLLVFLSTAALAQEDTTTTTTTTTTTSGLPTTTSTPCWLEAFPPPNITRTENELTCEICTVIFEGLDDTLLNNEEQIAHALENLCEGMPWLFEICWRLVEACVDDIIELLVEGGLNPTDMCGALLLCP